MPNAHNRKFHADTEGGKVSQDRLDASGDRKIAAVLFAGRSSASSMSSGFEFTTPDLSRNLVVCTGMRPIAGGEDATGVAMLETSFR